MRTAVSGALRRPRPAPGRSGAPSPCAVRAAGPGSPPGPCGGARRGRPVRSPRWSREDQGSRKALRSTARHRAAEGPDSSNSLTVSSNSSIAVACSPVRARARPRSSTAGTRAESRAAGVSSARDRWRATASRNASTAPSSSPHRSRCVPSTWRARASSGSRSSPRSRRSSTASRAGDRAARPRGASRPRLPVHAKAPARRPAAYRDSRASRHAQGVPERIRVTAVPASAPARAWRTSPSPGRPRSG